MEGITDQPRTPGVLGQNTNQTDAAGVGVHGKSRGTGVWGESETWHGVVGASKSPTGGFGVYGEAIGSGVVGVSKTWNGVYGETPSTNGGAGVWGEHKGQGTGVVGISRAGVGVLGQQITNDGIGYGVLGKSRQGIGVSGDSQVNSGVEGKSDRGTGVYAESNWNGALGARSHHGESPALFVNHRGTGDLISGIDNRNVEVFRVLNNGEVKVRGVTLTSDKNSKENFSSVNPLQVLDKLATISIQSWKFKEDPSSMRHIGPTAQDFHAAFGLNGDDNKHISSVDIQGVALAAIQGLNEKLMAENAQLHANLANLEARLSALESKG
ncbi:tail fiber domain-containing protein [Peribacillus sp. ACCC06369]|nr:tail fiber domain-containing protein [Peribacillus sp. ACCC06369]